MVELDLKESAQDGMGPHGLVIGATGSGKSELLRTMVPSLAVTHSSEDLNFVLVDFKGGATFASLDALPHTSAVITNLADELAMVDRMQDALAGEMIRRQELLRAAGNYVSRREYEQARLAGEPLAPLPSLLVICDEFSELLAAKPDFIDLFVMIGRLGRSLGVHLLLASQRLEEGRLRGLDTHLSYRIGLRTFSAMESRIVLGVPDAYELPNAPGHGYLKIGHRDHAAVPGGVRLRRRTAAPAAAGPRRRRVVQRQIVPFGVDVVPMPAAAGRRRAGAARRRPRRGRQTTMLDVIVGRLHGRGAPAHQVWLPPLAEPPGLDELLGPLGGRRARGLVRRRPGRARAGWSSRSASWTGRTSSAATRCWSSWPARPATWSSSAARSRARAPAAHADRVAGADPHARARCSSSASTSAAARCAALEGLPHVSGVAVRRDLEAVRRTRGRGDAR